MSFIYFTSLIKTYASGGYQCTNAKHGLYVEKYKKDKCKAIDMRWQGNNDDEEKLTGQKEKGTTPSCRRSEKEGMLLCLQGKKSETLWEASTETQRIFIVDISEGEVDG